MARPVFACHAFKHTGTSEPSDTRSRRAVGPGCHRISEPGGLAGLLALYHLRQLRRLRYKLEGRLAPLWVVDAAAVVALVWFGRFVGKQAERDRLLRSRERQGAEEQD